jgi:carboxypeptidase Taq
MSEPTPSERLYRLWAEVRDLAALEELLEWDQETVMPARGVEGRARLLATVAGIRHGKLTAAELSEAIAACAEAAAPGSVEAAQAAEARRQVDRAVRVPAALAAALAEAKTRAVAAWQEARSRADFPLFAPHLDRLLQLRREEAVAVAGEGPAYDALLDLYEPGATAADLAPLFADLRQRLTILVRSAVESGAAPDESAVRGHYPADRQRELALEVARAVGFDFEAGRLDSSAHPFCTGINPGDVRMTWRHQEDDFRPAFFGILHETGHGLYEQGLPEPWRRTPLGDAVSLGIHESQSRLWENQVGRSRAFWRWALPRLRELFPASRGLKVDRLWPALHLIRPSLIRVEADEATYNLHVIVRFELERALVGGDLAVSELPAAWDDAYEEMLGIRPLDAAQGVLQDIHWALGSFGYFPTYTLGTLAAAQLFAAAERALGGLEESFAAGDFRPLLAWLRDKVHRHGSIYRPGELIERATGRPLSPVDFLAYLGRVTEEAYGLTA